MPAAAVIPAPRAYRNVVAVKKPVVGSVLCRDSCLTFGSRGVGAWCECTSQCAEITCRFVREFEFIPRRHRRGHGSVFTSHVGLDARCRRDYESACSCSLDGASRI